MRVLRIFVSVFVESRREFASHTVRAQRMAARVSRPQQWITPRHLRWEGEATAMEVTIS
jgi:hypothetical protein